MIFLTSPVGIFGLSRVKTTYSGFGMKIFSFVNENLLEQNAIAAPPPLLAPDQDSHKYSNNSSISSLLKSILCLFLFLISIISSMMDIFQTSDSSIWWYLIFRTSSGTRWWILALSVIKRMLRRLEPVTEFASRRIESRRNFVAFFVEFLIWWRKDKNPAISQRTGAVRV